MNQNQMITVDWTKKVLTILHGDKKVELNLKKRIFEFPKEWLSTEFIFCYLVRPSTEEKHLFQVVKSSKGGSSLKNEIDTASIKIPKKFKTKDGKAIQFSDGDYFEFRFTNAKSDNCDPTHSFPIAFLGMRKLEKYDEQIKALKQSLKDESKWGWDVFVAVLGAVGIVVALLLW